MNLVAEVDLNGSKRVITITNYSRHTHLFTMLFRILSRCDFWRKSVKGLRAMGGKLNHLGMDQALAKSIACDGLRKRIISF